MARAVPQFEAKPNASPGVRFAAVAWILQNVSGDAAERELQHYQTTFVPLLFGVGIAMLLTLRLKETGSAVREKGV